MLEFGPFWLDLGHFPWIWAIQFGFGPQRRQSPEGGGGRMYVRTHIWTDRQIPPVLQDFVSFGAAAKKKKYSPRRFVLYKELIVENSSYCFKAALLQSRSGIDLLTFSVFPILVSHSLQISLKEAQRELEDILNDFGTLKSTIPSILLPLMRPFTGKVDNIIMKGLVNYSWASVNLNKCKCHLHHHHHDHHHLHHHY